MKALKIIAITLVIGLVSTISYAVTPSASWPPSAIATPIPLVFSPTAIQSTIINTPFCLGLPASHVGIQIAVNGTFIGSTTGDFCITFTAPGTYRIDIEKVPTFITVTAS